MQPRYWRLLIVALAIGSIAPAAVAQSNRLQSSDFYRLRSVGDVQLSPDGSRIAYTVQNSERPGRPYSQVWILEVASGSTRRLTGEQETSSNPRWSPDGQWLAYFGRADAGSGLLVVRADGGNARFLAPIQGTNHPLPSTGERLAWSPDSRRIAFVSATPGPETEAASGDPMVITRYSYKPAASEGSTRFNDNRRLHIFIVDIETQQVSQLTDGKYYEHSIDWSPDGREILFVSNREPDPDRFFNNDLFAINVADRTLRQLTHTVNAEYRPRWSPDGKSIAYQGTRRGLTSSETTMEDTHIWLINADGSGRREHGRLIDNRQGPPEWSPDGSAIYFTVQDRGHVRLYRLPVTGGPPEVIVSDAGAVTSWSVGKGHAIAYALHSPQDFPQLYLRIGGTGQRLTDLNREVLQPKRIAEVEAFSFLSFDALEVEAFLTKPLDVTAGSERPLVTMIKGGPHGQQGPSFNLKAQVYAAKGWAVLMVNYRGSTGYGQRFTDAIFRDQNGGEAKDVLYGVETALRKYPWLDPGSVGVEGGSYGGQLTNWLITQTHFFKAAIPAASIANLVSFHYMAFYHDYLAVEFGAFPHQENLIDLLWERSPLRYAAKVKTPTMFIHGENDNDVPIAEAEQYYIALKDVGVQTVMVRYPREGHGIRETKHVVDVIDRSIAWYETYFSSDRIRERDGK